VLVRVGSSRGDLPVPRLAWSLLTLATPVGLAAFAFAGPLQRGWARRAGTPTSLLHAAAPHTASRPTPTQAFSAALRGKLTKSSVPGGKLIDLALSLHGSATGTLRIRLAGEPVSGGGLSLRGSQVDLSDPAIGTALDGRIVTLTGTRFDARVDGGGMALDLRGVLSINATSGTVSGQLNAAPARSR
jgi:hypothetical protein